MKLRIGVEQKKAEDVLDVLEVVGISLSKYEIGAYFRKAREQKLQMCAEDQLLLWFF